VVKFSHKHKDGSNCYTIKEGHSPYTEIHLLTLVLPNSIGIQTAMAYKPYCNTWFLFDTKTGEEIGQFSGRSPLVDYFTYLNTGSLKMNNEC
jgi:hypothetical protein